MKSEEKNRREAQGMKYSMRSSVALILSAGLFSSACSKETTGPKPDVAGLDPALVCTEQLVTQVTLSGDRFSPVVTDGLTDDPKLALPGIRLRRTHDVTGAAVSGETELTIPDDPTNQDASRVTWTNENTMVFEVYPELEIEPGLYEVTVTNRNGESFTQEGALAAVAKPTLTSVVPDLVCLEQGMRTVSLNGTGFLQVGQTLPVVAFGNVTLPVTSMSNCTALPGPTEAQLCTDATVQIPEDALAPGAPALVLTNPDPAGCHSEEVITMGVVPRPTVATVVPDLVCVAQGDRQITITGTGFVDIDSVLPTVSIGSSDVVATATAISGCTDIPGTLLTARSCTTLTVVVSQNVATTGAFDVTVTNPDPAGCTSEEAVSMALVPRPTLSAAVPDLVCNTEGDRSIALTGTDFVTVDGVLPEVNIGGTLYSPSSAGGCSSVAGTLLTVESCTSLTVVVPQNDLGSGAHAVTVTNPAPAGCASTESVMLTVTPPPTLSSVQPELACNAGNSAVLTLDGSGFLDVDGVLPSITIGAQSFTADSAASCSTVTGPTETVSTCSTLSVTVPADTLTAGTLPVSVTNPAPAGCTSTQSVTLELVPPPVVSAVTPTSICTTQADVALTLDGTGFLTVDGTLPTVAITGTSPTDVTVDSASGCTAITTVTSMTVETCTSLAVTVLQNAVPQGPTDLIVTNPSPAACISSPAYSSQCHLPCRDSMGRQSPAWEEASR